MHEERLNRGTHIHKHTRQSIQGRKNSTVNQGLLILWYKSYFELGESRSKSLMRKYTFCTLTFHPSKRLPTCSYRAQGSI